MSTDLPAAPKRRRLRPLAAVLALALLGGVAVAAYVWSLYAGSLPPTDGSLRVEGLSSSVTIERDSLGVPTLKADDRKDLAFGCGFVHGQDRFFQMDLLRRHAAGELSELVGPAALDEDVHVRRHRFRHRARLEVERLPAADRDMLDAYIAGVEAGRGSLRQKPWEYHVLRSEPRPWLPEDTGLVVFAMYALLQHHDPTRETSLALVEELLPAPLARFLSPAGSPWDAPLIGPAFASADVPPPEAIDLRKDPQKWRAAPKLAIPLHSPGSNNWAVEGRHSAHGGALLACDMHLPLMVPGTWYRAAFVWQGHRVVGATLPGTPAMVVGSNGHVAWGFTNAEADTSDFVTLVGGHPDRPDYYCTADAELRLDRYEETIRVRGGPDRVIVVEESVHGPIVGRDRLGRRLALRWVAHERGAVNLALMGLETAMTVEEALAVGPRCGTPAQNLTVADDKGRIGWTILGRLPRRVGYDGRTPSLSDDGKRRWEGFVPADQYPRLTKPPTGRIWTANNRTVNEPHLSRLGFGAYDNGARAQQIRDGLLKLDKASEADMLAIQLDDRALFLTRWQGLFAEVLSSDAAKAAPRREAMRHEVKGWGGRAAIDSVGYRLVRQFRREVVEVILSSLTAPCRRADPTFDRRWLSSSVEQSVWLLATTKPAHLLPPGFADWDALLLACADRVAAGVRGKGTFEESLAAHTWGAPNVVQVRNPLSPGLGPLAAWMKLDMPPESLPGDNFMPRVQTPNFGASQRMAVSPGREDSGYFMMPAGQSGHPLSPHYRDGHDDWARGRATPFLPGAAVHVLELRPR